MFLAHEFRVAVKKYLDDHNESPLLYILSSVVADAANQEAAMATVVSDIPEGVFLSSAADARARALLQDTERVHYPRDAFAANPPRTVYDVLDETLRGDGATTPYITEVATELFDPDIRAVTVHIESVFAALFHNKALVAQAGPEAAAVYAKLRYGPN